MARTIRVLCEHCDQPFRTARDRLGEKAICPACGENTVLRDPSAPVEDPAPEQPESGSYGDADLLDQHAENAMVEMFGEGSRDEPPTEFSKGRVRARLTQKPQSKEVEADLDEAAAEAAAIFENDDENDPEGSAADVDYAARDAQRDKREYFKKRGKVIRHRREGDLAKSNYTVMKAHDVFERRFGRVFRKLRENRILGLGALVLALVVIVLIASVLRVVLFSGPSEPDRPAVLIEQAYYYDLNTGELFTSAASHTPPVPAPSGPYQKAGAPEGSNAGARAYVFSCTSCDEGNYIGYIEVHAPASKQALDQFNAGQSASIEAFPPPPAEGEPPVTPTPLFADVEEMRWVPAGSEPGLAIVNKAAEFCGQGKQPVRCTPEPVER